MLMVPEKIAWIDVETSGEDPETDHLLEIGCVMTDMSGNNSENPLSILVKHNELKHIIDTCDDTVKNMHEQSGLWDSLWFDDNTVKLSKIEEILMHWLGEENAMVYFGGNSPYLDRRFLMFNFPRFYGKLSHRTIDVTSIGLFLKHNFNIVPFFKKRSHRALADAYDSIEEYKYYLNHLGGPKFF